MGKTTKMALVGMDVFWGSCQELDAFDRSIYDGIEAQEQLLSPIFSGDETPKKADIKDWEINPWYLKVTADEATLLNPQQLLIRQVVDNSLRDAGLAQGGNVAVVIALGGNAAFKTLEVAQMLLADREVHAVVVGAVATAEMVGPGALAVVLQLHEIASPAQNHIYAVIDAISLVQSNPSKELDSHAAVTRACEHAFNLAGIKPEDVSYLEVVASGFQPEDELEIKGLLQAYQATGAARSCAIGSVKANVGHTYAASEIASMIKTALCLYHRYIPASPQGSSPKSLEFLSPEVGQGSPFYVAAESRPWFLKQGATRRVAAINSMGLDGTYAHLILSEDPSQKERHSRYLEQTPFYLFPLAALERSALLEQLGALQETIENCSSLSAAAHLTYAAFQKRSQATYALAILGRNKDELLREIKRALQGVNKAFESGEDWQTPVGSYFTANPLGQRGRLADSGSFVVSSPIAFVYPGAFNSYIGLARNLFRLFPKIYDDPVIKSVYSRVANIEKILYPRSLKPLSKRQLEALEKQFTEDPLAMLESGTGIAGLITAVMRDYFQVRPQCTFGYSLGEISMMYAQSVWTSYNQASDALNSSPLFRTRLSGPKNAVRDYWGLPQKHDDTGQFWSTYILMAEPSQVRERLKHENRVYLTHINTPTEVAIAGDPQAIRRVIESLNCEGFPTPFDQVIHCEAMTSEYNELVKVNTLPIQNVPENIFYSAGDYQPIPLESDSVAHNIGKCLCQPLDFPRLINRAYEDGARIFIETGVGGNCSRWIGETLKQKEHVTIVLNRRGVDDHTSIVRGLAKLLSHRVSMDLSLLYSKGEKSIIDNSFSPQEELQSDIAITTKQEHQPIPAPSTTNHNVIDAGLQLLPTNEPRQSHASPLNEGEIHTRLAPQVEKPAHGTASPITTPAFDDANSNSSSVHSLSLMSELPDLRNPQYQQVSDNNTSVTKIHAAFLQARQESLRQISEIIQLQIGFLQQVVDRESLVDISNEPLPDQEFSGM